jgi:hypothetical protein
VANGRPLSANRSLWWRVRGREPEQSHPAAAQILPTTSPLVAFGLECGRRERGLSLSIPSSS